MHPAWLAGVATRPTCFTRFTCRDVLMPRGWKGPAAKRPSKTEERALGNVVKIIIKAVTRRHERNNIRAHTRILQISDTDTLLDYYRSCRETPSASSFPLVLKFDWMRQIAHCNKIGIRVRILHVDKITRLPTLDIASMPNQTDIRDD